MNLHIHYINRKITANIYAAEGFLCTGIKCHVVDWQATNVSKEHVASSFMVNE
jgi:hypothetical protein